MNGVVTRLGELCLLDDEAFARQWIVERARRGLSAAALRDELRAKGIDREGVEAALQAAGLDDHAQAAATAARQVKRVAHLPLPTQAARLQGALLRRGFAADVAEEAVRAVLPPEGWD